MAITLDTRLPYRIGSPILPVLPIVSRVPSQPLSKYLGAADVQKINDILRSFQIRCDWNISHRLHESDRAQEDLLTLLVVSRARQHSNTLWTMAVSEIRKYFNTIGLNYAIEMIDKRAHDGLQTRIVHPADADIELWNTTILPRVVEALGQQDWLSVDVLRREHPHHPGSDPISLIICARDADDPTWWNTITPSLTSILNAYELYDVQIVVLYLSELLHCDKTRTEPDQQLLKEVYRQDENWLMGASCGQSGSRSSGTLGGRVVLHGGDKTRFMGLTNFHVLCNQDSNMGIVQVSIPSDSDHQRALQASQADLESAQGELKEENQRVIAIGKRHRKMIKIQLDFRTAERRGVKELNRNAGDVYASSLTPWNEPDSTSWAMDWCLFETLYQKTVLSTLLYPTPTGTAYTTIRAEEYASISRKDYVYDVVKRGRSSNWTKGTTSAIRSAIRISSSSPNPKIPGPSHIERSTNVNKTLYCYGIISKNQKQFLDHGDSGAFILLDESFGENYGVIIGLAFTGNLSSNASYMIPMDLVVKSIVQETKCRVIEPSYVGEICGRNTKNEYNDV
ncbi:hypothetical protein P154DRAFT_571895 [Amniculicola lignicola CBS 123094]|uniref:Uncharacterized protein n=1 Tax=Amniculicola lignicola CBS 123094 TaxID=1392246 RepID=A0A6A5X205_9PLEO|nr:hypothetical protein P154DRAFT_571895 [Amniculicola lignicola CBS 123094]